MDNNNYYSRNGNNYGATNNNSGGFYGAPTGTTMGAPNGTQGAASPTAVSAYGATTAPPSYGAWSGNNGVPGVPPPYGAPLPRYGGPGAYYGTHTPATPSVVGGAYRPPTPAYTTPSSYGNGAASPTYGVVVSPTRPTPVVAPTGPPPNGGQQPPSNGPPMPTPAPSPVPPMPTNDAVGRQRPTRLSLINRTATIVECQWRATTGATGSFRVPQSHAHMFAAPAPLEYIRIYAVASDGPLADILYEGPRDPAPGVPPLGPVLGLLAAGCGVFETMLDFYLGTASGTNGAMVVPARNNNGNGNNNNTNNDNVQPRPPNNGPMPPPNMPPSGAMTGNARAPASSTIGAIGTWRATDIAAAWVRTCHGGHCGAAPH